MVCIVVMEVNWFDGMGKIDVGEGNVHSLTNTPLNCFSLRLLF